MRTIFRLILVAGMLNVIVALGYFFWVGEILPTVGLIGALMICIGTLGPEA